MRASKTISALVLLFAALLFVAGCGGGAEQGATPKEEAPKEEAPKEEAPKEEAPATSGGGGETEPSTTVEIATSSGERVPVQVEIADDNAERMRGLMERTDLAEDAGMLFVFDREQGLAFYMRNTLIPLSIAYIDSGGRIVDIEDMQPLDETSIPSDEPAQYALEVNQGFFAERGVQVGDQVELPNL